NLVSTTVDRGTGVASRLITLLSSISAPSTLVPMISAVSGTTTVKPKMPRNSGGHTGLFALTLSSTVIAISSKGAITKISARLRPTAALIVSLNTTGLNTSALDNSVLPFTAPPGN